MLKAPETNEIPKNSKMKRKQLQKYQNKCSRNFQFVKIVYRISYFH